MIQKFTAQNYGCIKDISLQLTPLHAIVGPNDCGKSTLLEAMALLAGCSGAQRFDDSRIRKFIDTSLIAEFTEGLLFGALWKKGLSNIVGPIAPLKYALIRWDADQLRAPSGLLTETDLLAFYNSRGQGLPAIYDAILSRGDETFHEISRRVSTLFHSVKRLRLKTTSDQQKVIEIELKTGQRVEAKHMSEGLLYYLAFEALRYIEDVKLLLIEEPENGLHPARIHEVIHMLRELTQQGTQVILSTHSPLVLNELNAEEITILWRPEAEGTQGIRLIDTPEFSARREVFSPGEMWLNYCNGVDEAPLVKGLEGMLV